jgi:adenylosuccinate lyase/3-carboxy-cis,cis-muconate cycloisomerase
MTASMFDSFITGHWFSAEAKCVWSDSATLQAWLDVEAALAQAQAALGLIPHDAAQRIAEKSHARLFDTLKLAEDIAHAQHPLVPVLHQLEQLCGEPAAGFIHWGATTQNIFDTASSLQMRETHTILMRHLDASIASLGGLALAHRSTVMPGRTHGQHALPMTLGFKLTGWIAELDRHRTRLKERLASSFTASMGGAIGTYAAMGAIGRQVETRMAEQLGLLPAGLPMRSSYDRVNDYVGALAMLAATAQKIAQDVVFMQRTEVGEAAEAFHVGKVGSSTMAQKRNPSTALLLVSLCRMLRGRAPMALEAMVRMDEGDSSATNVCDTLLPEIAILAASIAETLSRLARGLIVHPDRMKRNLALTNGLIASEAAMMCLTRYMGRHQAHRLLYEAAQRSQSDGVPFAQAIREHALWATEAFPAEVLEALDPAAYVGESAALTAAFVDLASTPRG